LKWLAGLGRRESLLFGKGQDDDEKVGLSFANWAQVFFVLVIITASLSIYNYNSGP